MRLTPGTRLGPYSIVAHLGTGGMGEVYRADDTRLQRAVAIKVLPRELLPVPDARERLQREARTLSHLTHSNICALFDVGEDGDTDFLVMELLEGETLADRIARGPLGLTETLDIGAQIASALAHAHQGGITHRDLKPGNIMLTRAGAKLLDFGLAKALAPAAQVQAGNVSTALDLTTAGTVLGTLRYMAPEQIEGRPADHRTDIFALGVVLFEMATGRRAFAGDTTAAIAGAILTVDTPPISSLQPNTPAAFDHVLRVCLEKRPEKRWQSAQDVAVLLRSVEATAAERPAPRARGSGRWLPWSVAAAAAAVALGLWLRPSPNPVAAMPVTFSVPPPPNLGFMGWVESSTMAMSPDGSRLAFVASNAGVWIRPLASLNAAPVAGAERANAAFWSPDGRSIGFFGYGMLSRVDASGGPVVPLCSVAKWTGHTGTWGADGIVFGAITGQALLRVPTAGGTPVELIKPDPARHETRLLWPHFLPDGRRLLYTAWRDDRSGRLMLWEPETPPREIMPAVSNVQYVEPGYLLFVRDGTLLAQRFDASTAALSGDPVAIAQPVQYQLIPGTGQFSASRTGVIAYQPHSDLAHVASFDRTGRDLGTLLPSGKYQTLRLSPDGRQLAFERATQGAGTYDVWLFDIQRGTERRVTSDSGNEVYPIWAPDRSALVFSSSDYGPPRIVVRDLSTGAERPIPGEIHQLAEDFTPGGESLLYRERIYAAGTFQLLTIPLRGSRPASVLDPRHNYAAARFSPDGKWLAYVSDESGNLELYVARWPISGEKARVSTAGGTRPRWAHDGRELFYTSTAGLMRVPMSSGQPGNAQLAFDKTRAGAWTDFDVAADGRFFAIVSESIGARQPLSVLVNWTSRLP